MVWRSLLVLLLLNVTAVFTLPLVSQGLEWIEGKEGHLRFRREALESEQKRPSFQPWGGKRQAEIPVPAWDTLDDDTAALVARSFNPWGGKKRSTAELLKRKFQPWGGKRSEGDESMVDMIKRKFQPWGGKRQVLDVEDLKRRFNPWAGKRSGSSGTDSSESTSLKEDIEDYLLEKRGFQPWGGKRGFQPWGGKRASFQPWGGKRGFQPWGGKRGFQPWGGKRSGLDEAEGEGEDFKRQAFQPWAGKRNSDSKNLAISDLFQGAEANDLN